METRKEVRIKKNIRILIKDDRGSYPAQVTSISKSGMSIKTDVVFPTYKVLHVIIKIDQKMIPIKGCVRWAYEPPDDAEDQQYQMGLSLQNPPPEYIRHYEKLATAMYGSP